MLNKMVEFDPFKISFLYIELCITHMKGAIKVMEEDIRLKRALAVTQILNLQIESKF